MVVLLEREAKLAGLDAMLEAYEEPLELGGDRLGVREEVRECWRWERAGRRDG